MSIGSDIVVQVVNRCHRAAFLARTYAEQQYPWYEVFHLWPHRQAYRVNREFCSIFFIHFLVSKRQAFEMMPFWRCLEALKPSLKYGAPPDLPVFL